MSQLTLQRKIDGDVTDDNQSVAGSVASKSLAEESMTSSMQESSYASSVSISQQDSVKNRSKIELKSVDYGIQSNVQYILYLIFF